MRPRGALVALCVCGAGAGCIPYALLLPPSQLTLGGATIGPGGPGGSFHLRAGINPLQLHPSLVDRVADAGAGFLLELGGSDRVRDEGGRLVQDSVGVWGLYLEGGAVLANAPMTGNVGDLLITRGRIVARGHARLAWADAPFRGISTAGPGVGAAVQLVAEAVGFENRGFNTQSPDNVTLGISYGEASAGLYLEGAYTQFAGGGLWSIGAGLLFRFPLVALVGCLPIPDETRASPPAHPAQPSSRPASPPPARPATPPARPAEPAPATPEPQE